MNSSGRRHNAFSNALPLLVVLLVLCHCQGWSSSSNTGRQVNSKLNGLSIRMDTEGPMLPYAVPAFFQKPALFQSSPTARSKRQQKQRFGHGIFGLPWKSSIVPNVALGCVYMPFWEWQLSLMQSSLQNVQLLEDSCVYVESPTGQHRMVTLTASSDEYRMIRMTYLDGGDKVQIFTSVWYPRGNLPLFGMDALQFQNGKRNLAICDFQPLHSNEQDHDATYEHLLEPIRQSVPNLQDVMTDRFFDPSRYFSKQTLLGRFQTAQDPQEVVWSELWPAYKAYLQTHIQLVQQQQHHSTLSPAQVLEHHKSYDNYVAQCDPAHPMFASIFGSDVAKNYVYDVLFPLADRPDDLTTTTTTESS